MVKTVGFNIQIAVEKYFAQHNLSDELNGYAWEFNLIESPEVNAWCMPGGKVVVYTGILPITKDETGLAVVMGHEIAHAIAEHGNERMSQQLLQQVGAVVQDVDRCHEEKHIPHDQDLLEQRRAAIVDFGKAQHRAQVTEEHHEQVG